MYVKLECPEIEMKQTAFTQALILAVVHEFNGQKHHSDHTSICATIELSASHWASGGASCRTSSWNNLLEVFRFVRQHQIALLHCFMPSPYRADGAKDATSYDDATKSLPIAYWRWRSYVPASRWILSDYLTNKRSCTISDFPLRSRLTCISELY